MTVASLSVLRPAERPGGEIESARQAAIHVYECVRTAIINLEMKPGTPVDRAELQATFGRSSTPIRDALTRLSEEGLVDIVPQSATRVSLIDVGKARETQFLRRALELEAVEVVAAAPDKSVVPVLREIVARQRAAAAEKDIGAFDRLDKEFHFRIFQAAGIADLVALLRQRSGHIDRIRRLHLPVAGKLQEIVRAHSSIIKAVGAGDAPEARKRVRDHLSRSLAYAPALKEQYPSYFR